MGNAGEVNLAIGGHDASGGAIERVVEAIGIQPGFFRDSVTVLVFEHADLFRILGVVIHRLLVGILFVEFQALGGAAQADLILDPMPVAAVVLDTTVEAVGLRDEKAVLLVHGYGGGVEYVRLLGENLSLHALGVGDGGNKGLLRFDHIDRFLIGRALDFAGCIVLLGKGEERGGTCQACDAAEREKQSGKGIHAWVQKDGRVCILPAPWPVFFRVLRRQ